MQTHIHDNAIEGLLHYRFKGLAIGSHCLYRVPFIFEQSSKSAAKIWVIFYNKDFVIIDRTPQNPT